MRITSRAVETSLEWVACAARRPWPCQRCGFSAIIFLLVGCSGPPPLSRAIREQERSEFVPMLRESAASPREGYFRWKAQTTGRSIAEIASSDAALSTKRNPFNANRDRVAVSRGAAIYQVQCASCHGENVDGRGTAMQTIIPRMDFHAFPKRFAVTVHGGAPMTWFKRINEGYSSGQTNPNGSPVNMPAFKDTLAREQIWLAITYLQSLDMHVKEDAARESTPE